MDLSKLSTEDLMALKDKKYSELSTEGLEFLASQQQVKPLPLKKRSETKSVPPPKEFSFREMVGNIPSSGMQFMKDMVYPIMNPVDTAKSLYNIGAGGVQKLIPGEQEQEKYFNQAAQMYSDRYGDWEKFKQTAMQDPVGVLSDVAGVAMGGGAALKGAGTAGKLSAVQKAGNAVGKLGTALDPMNLAFNTAIRPGARAAARLIPSDVPHKLYQSAAKFSTTMSDAERASLAETAMREGIRPSPRGVKKLDKLIKPLEETLGREINKATLKYGDAIPVDALFDHLDSALKKHGGYKLFADRDTDVINGIKQQYLDYMEKQGRGWLTPKEVQDFKIDVYSEVKWDKKNLRAEAAKETALKTIGRGAREQIEKYTPGVAEINKRLGELYELKLPLSRAAARVENKNLLPFDAAMKIGALSGAGYAMGGEAGAKIGAGAGLLGSIGEIPTVKSRAAINLFNAQNRPLIDLFSDPQMRAAVRAALAEAGQLEQNQEK